MKKKIAVIIVAVFAVPKISFYACDGDEIVKHGFMYFSLSKSENNELRKIMKKYGADTKKAI